MEDFIVNLISNAISLYESFLDSTFFIVLKICLGIYSLVLFVNIVLLIYLYGVKKSLLSIKYGVSNVTQTKGERRAQWKKIRERLTTDSQSELKLAVLEAEHLVYKALEEVGYGGETFKERVDKIPPGTCSSMETVMNVHAFRNQIVQDDSVVVALEQARQAVEIYYDFLDDLGAV